MSQNVSLLDQINEYTIMCHDLYQKIKVHMQKIDMYKAGGQGGDMAEQQIIN
jgi:hypothetical protein